MTESGVGTFLSPNELGIKELIVYDRRHYEFTTRGYGDSRIAFYVTPLVARISSDGEPGASRYRVFPSRHAPYANIGSNADPPRNCAHGTCAYRRTFHSPPVRGLNSASIEFESPADVKCLRSVDVNSCFIHSFDGPGERA